jgi:general secretion pathway protein C
MMRYYYIILGSIGVVLLIALLLLSYVDRTVLSPSPSARHVTAPAPSGGMGTESAPATGEGAPPQAHSATEEGGMFSSPSLTLRLIGTTVFGEKSSAIIEDRAKKTRGVYRLRDAIKGLTIAAIDNDSVTLTSDGRSFVLTLTPDSDRQDSDSFFTKIDDNSWLVSADKAADMVSNIDQYAGQVIAFQHRVNGQAAGFKIRHLKEGNDFEKLGLKNNDIIKRVNGLEVNDLTDVLKAMYQLSDETEFTVEVEGDAGPRALNYNVGTDISMLGPLTERLSNLLLGGTANQ